MTADPATLETYAAIFEKRRRYWDDQIKQWYYVGPTDIELAAAAALRFQANAIHIERDMVSGFSESDLRSMRTANGELAAEKKDG